MEIAERVLAGNIRAVARLMTELECNRPYALKILHELYPHTGKAHIVGVTGAPGVGKSTLIDSVTRSLRRRGMTVGILAIDPTSPFTGGALLGDRVRMEKHNTDPGVFIRSLATRGGTGGLSRAALRMAHVLDAMGKDMVIIETVGIGQAEIDITKMTDTSVLILVPGMGDTIQLMKAGILEAADIFVINKSSRDGAETLRAELENMPTSGRQRPVILTESVLNQGTEEVVEQVFRHKQDLISSGELRERRRKRAVYELMSDVEGAVRNAIEAGMKGEVERLAEDIIEKKTDPSTAAAEILENVFNHIRRAP
ncbi:MAG: methylmalonyl Co-A mutase-associated GTPase MeaB [Dehalococcoidia bacterium]|nr:methylmalonyl Co-A mutase-associated GTPase MeaB [Dehalococcoidia bacterium]